jgi:xylan 1,4-beta-xylosidase
VGGWYYLLTAEGGTGYEHCVTVARSKNLRGPYTVDPDNPMLTSDMSERSRLKKCGHADLVEGRDRTWYMVHLCSRPRPGKTERLLGRATALPRVCWTEDGWLRLSGGGKQGYVEIDEPQSLKHTPVTAPEKDDFDGDTLAVFYSSPRIPLGENASLTRRKGWLRLYGKESLNSLHQVTLLARRQQEYRAFCETKMAYAPRCPEQMAGLVYYYDTMNYYMWAKSRGDDGTVTLNLIQSDTGAVTDVLPPIPVKAAGDIYLRIETNAEGSEASFYYSYDGRDFIKAGAALPTRILTDEHCRGFTGAHFGLFAFDMTGAGLHADFDYFTCHNERED